MEVTLTPELLNADGSIKIGTAHSRMYAAAKEGRVFQGVSASGGIALIVPATTGGHPTLWNPRGSGVLIDVKRLILSYVSGDNAPTAIEWASTLDAGADVGTGARIATATRVAATNVITGGPVNSKAYWSPTTNTFAASPVFLRPSGISLFTGVAATAVAPFTMIADYDGDLMVGDGTAISLCAQASTTTALFQVCVVWEEIAL